jgi:Family of unknown function (DUF6427)
MLRIFGVGNVVVLALLPAVIAIFQLLNLQGGYYEFSKDGIDLGIWGNFDGFNHFWRSFLAGVFVSINAVLINFVFNKNNFFPKNTFYPSILYVTVMSFNHCFYELNGIIIGHFLIIMALNQLLNLEQNTDGRSNAFLTGLFLGVGATLHTPLITILPIAFLMVWVIRPFVFRETLLILAGFITPLLYGLSFKFLKNINIWVNPLKDSLKYHEKEYVFLASSFALALLFLISLFAIRNKMSNSSIRLKKMVRILWFLVFYALFLGILNFAFYKRIEWFSYGAIPLSFFLPFAFEHKSLSFFATFFYYAVLIISLCKFMIF